MKQQQTTVWLSGHAGKPNSTLKTAVLRSGLIFHSKNWSYKFTKTLLWLTDGCTDRPTGPESKTSFLDSFLFTPLSCCNSELNLALFTPQVLFENFIISYFITYFKSFAHKTKEIHLKLFLQWLKSLLLQQPTSCFTWRTDDIREQSQSAGLFTARVLSHCVFVLCLK